MTNGRIAFFCILCLIGALILAENTEKEAPSVFSVNYDWNCSITRSGQGNFPHDPGFGDFIAMDSSFWSTADLSEKGRFAHRWSDINQPVGFFIHPHESGHKNRIVVHLTSRLLHPFSIPYFEIKNYTVAEAYEMSPHEHARAIIPQGPFNCYIRRDIDYMTDVLYNLRQKCPSHFTFLKCLEYQDFWKNYQCVAGTKIPICCYVNFFNTYKDKAALRRLSRIHGDFDFNELLKYCSKPAVVDLGADNYCKPKWNLPSPELDDFYTFNRNISCNRFLRPTQKSCLIARNGRQHVMPCFARCLIGLVTNIEMSAADPLGDYEGETYISVISKFTDFNQKYYELESFYESGYKGTFGYNPLIRKTHSAQNVQVFKLKVPTIPLIANQTTGIWIRWSKRVPTCIPALDIPLETPILQVGTDGSAMPIVEVDFACTNFEGDSNDELGWRFGWFGLDIVDPPLNSVWRPSYFAVNSANHAGFSLTFAGNETQCRDLRQLGPMPDPLKIASALIILAACFLFSICLCSRDIEKKFIVRYKK